VGNRLRPGGGMADFDSKWIGEGDLPRTSPEALLQWMLDPHQEVTLERCRRHLQGFIGSMIRGTTWWALVGTAPVPGAPGETCTWVTGSNGHVTCVLRLPKGQGRAEGLARFRTLMKIPDKR